MRSSYSSGSRRAMRLGPGSTGRLNFMAPRAETYMWHSKTLKGVLLMGSLVFPDEPDDDALDFDRRTRLDDDRIHGGVGGLEADMIFLFVEALECGLAAVDEGDNHFTVAGSGLLGDDDVVAGVDAFVDHGVAFDLQDVGVLAADHEGRDFESFG